MPADTPSSAPRAGAPQPRAPTPTVAQDHDTALAALLGFDQAAQAYAPPITDPPDQASSPAPAFDLAAVTGGSDPTATPPAADALDGALLPSGVIHVTTPPIIGLPDPTPFHDALFPVLGQGSTNDYYPSLSRPSLTGIQALISAQVAPTVSSSHIPEDHTIPLVVTVPGQPAHVLSAGLSAFFLSSGNTLNIANIHFGSGSDTLVFAGGGITILNSDTILGSSGTDLVTAASALTSGTVDLGGGNDTLVLSVGGNTLSVANIEIITGSAGGDKITNIGTSATSFSGGTGNDTYTAGSGGDTIAGNGGADSLVAGSGSDVFKYTALGQSSASTLDILGNFHIAGGQSRIDIQGIDTGGVAIEGSARTYTGTLSTDFAGVAANTIAFATDGTNTYVYYHTGAGYSASDLHVQLAGVNANATPLTLANFLHH